jgi:hypothetical protein
MLDIGIWFNSWLGGKSFSLFESNQTGSGAYQWLLGSLSLALNESHSYSKEKVKNAWNYNPTLPYAFMYGV